MTFIPVQLEAAMKRHIFWELIFNLPLFIFIYLFNSISVECLIT